MIDSIGGRKMAICVVTVLICVGAVLYKGDVPQGLSDMLKFIVGTFIAGNVGADVVAAVSTSKQAAAPAVVPEASAPAPTSEELSQVLANTATLVATATNHTQALSYIASRLPG